ncbi:MAG: TetR/AcrR family transcriptional regulator [Polyangiaceae bacterium]
MLDCVPVIDISSLLSAAVEGPELPPRPAEELDDYLDAVERCVRRYGWSRTSPQDIARELGINRTTVYRVLGTRDRIFELLVSREVHRLIDRVSRHAVGMVAAGTAGADIVVEVCALAIEEVRANPTTAKLLADEPELVSEFLRDGVPAVVARFADAFAPMLGLAMQHGRIAHRDPHIVTEWAVRMCLSLLFAPPRGDLRSFLAEGLRPLFAV